MSVVDEQYIIWLIDDQAYRLINMTYEQIAKVMGISRQTMAKYEKAHTYKRLTVDSVNRLIKHLEYTKSAILTTEEV